MLLCRYNFASKAAALADNLKVSHIRIGYALATIQARCKKPFITWTGPLFLIAFHISVIFSIAKPLIADQARRQMDTVSSACRRPPVGGEGTGGGGGGICCCGIGRLPGVGDFLNAPAIAPVNALDTAKDTAAAIAPANTVTAGAPKFSTCWKAHSKPEVIEVATLLAIWLSPKILERPRLIRSPNARPISLIPFFFISSINFLTSSL